MSVISSFRYQFAKNRNDFLIYYIIWGGVVILSVVGSVIHSLRGGAGAFYLTTNGITAVTAICAFAEGVTAFKENFRFAVQNGVSRKSLFLARLLSSAAVCAVFAVMDEAVTLLVSLTKRIPGVENDSSPLLAVVYDSTVKGMNPALLALLAVVFSFFVLLACVGAGYFVTILYYRLPTGGKIAVSVSVPAFLIFIIPVLKTLRDRFNLWALWEALEDFAAWLFHLTLGGPVNCCVTCLALFALFSLLAWLLMRRAAVKK